MYWIICDSWWCNPKSSKWWTKVVKSHENSLYTSVAICCYCELIFRGRSPLRNNRSNVMLASSIFPSGSISTDNSTNQSTPDLRKKKRFSSNTYYDRPQLRQNHTTERVYKARVQGANQALTLSPRTIDTKYRFGRSVIVARGARPRGMTSIGDQHM